MGATTSASIVIDENEQYGTTKYIANFIQKAVGGDIHRIETVIPYTADFDELRDVNHEEMEQNLMPEIKESKLDISHYNTVFMGYPVIAEASHAAVSLEGLAVENTVIPIGRITSDLSVFDDFDSTETITFSIKQ